MALDAAKGIAELHRLHIIHCDIACRNLLLDDRQRVWWVVFIYCDLNWRWWAIIESWIIFDLVLKCQSLFVTHQISSFCSYFGVVSISFPFSIGDFGLSVINDNPDHELQMFHQEPKPPRWCAPEALSERNLCSLKMDAFMFGCTLWEMFTRTKPFAWMDEEAKRSLPAEDINERRKSLMVSNKDTVTSFYKYFPQGQSVIPVSALAIMFACLNDEPDHRPTMNEVVTHLEMSRNMMSMLRASDNLPVTVLPNLRDLLYPSWLEQRILRSNVSVAWWWLWSEFTFELVWSCEVEWFEKWE